MDYQKQAKDFLESTGTTLKIEFLKRDKHFEDDTEKRNIYTCTLKRGLREYTFQFGDSIMNTYGNNDKVKRYLTELDITRIEQLKRKWKFSWKEIISFPILERFNNSWIVLTTSERKEIIRLLTTKPTEYDILAWLETEIFDSLQDFCDCFGYDADSIKANKIFDAVQDQAKNLQTLFNDSELERLAEIR